MRTRHGFWTGALAAVAAAGLCACASEPPARHGRFHGGPDGPGAFGGPGGPGDPPARPHRPAAPALFVSPAGKPWRSNPGDPYPTAAWFAAVDSDHDGRISRAEFAKDAESFFHELDVDRNGVIDGFELTRYEQEVAPEIVKGFHPAMDEGPGGGDGPRGGGRHGGGGRGGGHGGMGGMGGPGGGPGGGHGGGMGGGHGGGMGGGPGGGDGGSGGGRPKPETDRPQGAAWFSLENIPEPVASADKDFDGRITLAEFLKTADDRYDALLPEGAKALSFDQLPLTPVEARLAGRRGNRAAGG